MSIATDQILRICVCDSRPSPVFVRATSPPSVRFLRSFSWTRVRAIKPPLSGPSCSVGHVLGLFSPRCRWPWLFRARAFGVLVDELRLRSLFLDDSMEVFWWCWDFKYLTQFRLRDLPLENDRWQSQEAELSLLLLRDVFQTRFLLQTQVCFKYIRNVVVLFRPLFYWSPQSQKRQSKQTLNIS